MLFLKLYDDNDNFYAFLFFFLIFSAHGLKILVQKTHQKGVQIHLVVEKKSKWESKLGDFWTACNVSTTLAKW